MRALRLPSTMSGLRSAGLSKLPPPASGSGQRVLEFLRAYQPTTALDVAGLAVYHHCAYAVFAQDVDARRTSELSRQLLAGSELLLASPVWTAAQFEQACTLAWLQSHAAAADTAPAMRSLLSRLDQLVEQQMPLLEPSDSSARCVLVQTMRYLGLRLPAASAARSLQALLRHPAPQLSAEPWLMGLPDGLAGDLLLRLRLRHLGLPDEALPGYVRASISRLLATRRAVDFSQNSFSVFPYQVSSSPAQAWFSAALTWNRGDLPQALLLYEAYELLQDEELVKIAELVGLNTLLRTSSASTEVTGSRFCRGAAGVAHLYRRLYLVSGQAAYKQGYYYWLDQTQQWLHQEFDSLVCAPQAGELLSGLAGVGLVLMSATTNVDLDWDTIVF